MNVKMGKIIAKKRFRGSFTTGCYKVNEKNYLILNFSIEQGLEVISWYQSKICTEHSHKADRSYPTSFLDRNV